MQTLLELQTRGQGLYEFTGNVARWLEEEGAGSGLLTLFVRHTSAVDQFDRNLPTQRLLPGPVHRTHTALVDLGENDVVADGLELRLVEGVGGRLGECVTKYARTAQSVG